MLEQIIAKCKELEAEFTNDFAKITPPYSPQELKRRVMEEVQDELSYPILAKLQPQEQLQIAREYLKSEKPTALENLVMLSLNVNPAYSTERAFNPTESIEFALAFAKCAADTDLSRSQKHELSRNLQHLVERQPETARMALNILSDYLCDCDIIDPIRTCISRNKKLADKGFAAIQKNVATLHAADENDNPYKKYIDKHLAVAFRDLYEQYAGKSPEITDIITENFILLNKHLDPHKQKISHIFLECRPNNQLSREKIEILYESFKQAEAESEQCPFGEIYAEKLAQHAEKLEQLTFRERVTHKVRKNNDFAAKEAQTVLPNSLKYNLIHVGEEKPTAEKFKRISNARRSIFKQIEYDKPSGGLWSSLALKSDPDIGQWEDFCNRVYTSWKEKKLKGSWHIVPNDDCRILEYHKLSDVRPYLRDTKHPNMQCTDAEIVAGINEFIKTGERRIYVDYAAISREYDLFIIENQFPNHPLFGNLDCDSGLVMHFDKVTIMENKDYANFIADETKRFAQQLANSDIDHTTLKRPLDIDLNKRVMQAHFAAKKASTK